MSMDERERCEQENGNQQPRCETAIFKCPRAVRAWGRWASLVDRRHVDGRQLRGQRCGGGNVRQMGWNFGQNRRGSLSTAWYMTRRFRIRKYGAIPANASAGQTGTIAPDRKAGGYRAINWPHVHWTRQNTQRSRNNFTRETKGNGTHQTRGEGQLAG